MSMYIEPTATIGEAWLHTLQEVHAAGGEAVNVLSTITDPIGQDHPGIRRVIDEHLVDGTVKKLHVQPVDTVANTIFSDLYRDPGITWSDDLDDASKLRVQGAADRLYSNYGRILPLLTQIPVNSHGTYFGRMISWPGKAPGGINQLQKRIDVLRRHHQQHHSRFNAADIVVGGEARDLPDVDSTRGVQIYDVVDHRERGFPCLVHIDLSVFHGRLNLIATYRHQYLVTKSYGNAVGLARLLRFLCQQTGYSPGELSMMATMADAEYQYWQARGVAALLDAATGASQ